MRARLATKKLKQLESPTVQVDAAIEVTVAQIPVAPPVLAAPPALSAPPVEEATPVEELPPVEAAPAVVAALLAAELPPVASSVALPADWAPPVDVSPPEALSLTLEVPPVLEALAPPVLLTDSPTLALPSALVPQDTVAMTREVTSKAEVRREDVIDFMVRSLLAQN